MGAAGEGAGAGQAVPSLVPSAHVPAAGHTDPDSALSPLSSLLPWAI